MKIGTLIYQKKIHFWETDGMIKKVGLAADPNRTRIEVFSRSGRNMARVGVVEFSFEQGDITYVSRYFGALERDAAKYKKTFSRQLDFDAQYVSLQIVESLKYASKIGIYNAADPVRRIGVHMGDLSTWRQSAYGSDIAIVAAFVYMGNLHIRPASLNSWNVIQHETGHIIQLHNRRDLGRNSYPVPEIREGGAEIFRMAFGTREVANKSIRIERILSKYDEKHGKSVNVGDVLDYGHMLLHNSKRVWLKEMECHAAGAIIGLATLSLNSFDVEKTVRDLFAVSDTAQLSLLLRN